MNPDLNALIQMLIEGQIQLEEGMITHGEPEPLTDQLAATTRSVSAAPYPGP